MWVITPHIIRVMDSIYNQSARRICDMIHQRMWNRVWDYPLIGEALMGEVQEIIDVALPDAITLWPNTQSQVFFQHHGDRGAYTHLSSAPEVLGSGRDSFRGWGRGGCRQAGARILA